MDFFEKLNRLPNNVREYFSSNDVRLMLERACFLYNIPEDDIEKMALPIADIIFKDAKLSDLPAIVQQKLGVKNEVACGIAYELNGKIFLHFAEYFEQAKGLQSQWNMVKEPVIVSEEKAWNRVLEIEPWIIEEEREKRNAAVESQKGIDNLSVAQALQKYPKLEEQAVTNNQLKLKYSADLMRPSIKNWITDFHDNMGAGKHGAIDRGNYLFHSENGKKLTPGERQKLSVILKSLDEESPVTIDTASQTVLFDGGQGLQKSTDTFSPSASSQSQVSSFQSVEKTQATHVENVSKSSDDKSQKQEDVFEKYVPEKSSAGYSPNFARLTKQDETPKVINGDSNFEKPFERKFSAVSMQGKVPLTESDVYMENFSKQVQAASAQQKMQGNSDVVGFDKLQASAKLPVDGKISFSSPQTLPAEKTEPATVPNNENQTAKTSSYNNDWRNDLSSSADPWVIKPREFVENKKSDSNIVNLKEL